MYKHPRDIILQAHSQTGVKPPEDYIKYEKHLVEGWADKKLVKEFKDVLLDKSKNIALKKAWTLYQNWNNKIQYEGLLLNFSLEELYTLPKIDKDILNCYAKYFFNIDDFRGLEGKAVFIELIQRPEILEWFADCATRSIEDLRFRMSGKPTANSDLLVSLRKLYDRADSTAHTFMTTDSATLQKYTKLGLFTNERSMYDVGLKAMDAAVKIANLILRNPAGDEENFLNSWNIKVKREDDVLYNPTLDADIEEDLRNQMNDVNPITRSEPKVDADDLLYSEELGDVRP